MESISIFDIFKIGVGPSSSHTLGPWKAALDFRAMIATKDMDAIVVNLYGSLSKTGKGHATDIAIQLGLMGYEPEIINTQNIPNIIKNLSIRQNIEINGKLITFNPTEDIVFTHTIKELHPNTMEFFAYKNEGDALHQTYLSVGGGFIEKPHAEVDKSSQKNFPYPIETAAELIQYVEELNIPISEIVMLNETAFLTEEEVNAKIQKIFDVMVECVMNGCYAEGILPGGLNVRRRAKHISSQLVDYKQVDSFEQLVALLRKEKPDFNLVNKWVSCFALAVNEENAAMGRIVTSPTNGAAGVIPAVLLYYYLFCERKLDNDIQRFFCTAGEIGSLFKKGATISAAVGGCQAEIGVSSAMAAAGLTEVLGGSPAQVLMAAEIAMEHHLGLTCDPVGGLVQVPCIERNTMGAMKAITASNLALSSDPSGSVVALDTVIKSMWDTAQAMNSKYKETSEGGLAMHISVVAPEC